MANTRTLPVIEDVGSEELRQLRLAHNALVDLVGNLLDDLEGAGSVGAINTAATTRLAEVEIDTATVLKIGGEPGIVSRPRRGVTVP